MLTGFPLASMPAWVMLDDAVRRDSAAAIPVARCVCESQVFQEELGRHANAVKPYDVLSDPIVVRL